MENINNFGISWNGKNLNSKDTINGVIMIPKVKQARLHISLQWLRVFLKLNLNVSVIYVS